MDKHKSWLKRKFEPLTWPAELMRERVAANKDKPGFLNPRAATTAYPSRAIRYWWTHSYLLDELKDKKELKVLDLGCSTGKFPEYAGELPGCDFTGVDMDIDEEALKRTGYKRFVKADLSKPLPLEDDFADVVIFLHVLEHLPEPVPVVKEAARVLKPGGVLLAGTPVTPVPFAGRRDRMFRRKFEAGLIKPGAHVRCFSTGDWKRFLKAAGLEKELFFGAFLIRRSGGFMENSKLWLRLNQLWGILFPGLGQEIYLAARKPFVAGVASDEAPAPAIAAAS
ncbi:MAG: class I SAM-dependent methyltransferase [Deltaproteobacteria bacterium]|jgi:SAM-dependent methyltransferase|nr:class I SAM-dependent methyltransferase [Deltaproteobacteria bacterium]